MCFFIAIQTAAAAGKNAVNNKNASLI